MKPVYWKSIAIGLASILIIAALYLLAAYLAHLEWEEHYRTSPGSGVLLVGVYPWILFAILEVPLVFAVIGAFSAWASRRDITSIRGTILASALAALVPVAPATAIVLFLAAKAFTDTPEHYGPNFFTTLLPLFLIFLVYAFACLLLAIIGGLLYAMPGRALLHGKSWGTKISLRRPLIVGVAGGALVLIILTLAGGITGAPAATDSVILLSLFMIISMAAGALSVSLLPGAWPRMADTLKASMATGTIVGLAADLYLALRASAGMFYMELPGILVLIGTFLSGIILAAAGGVLFTAFIGAKHRPAPEAPGMESNAIYRNPVKVGLVIGLALAVLSVVPELAYAILSSFGSSDDIQLYISINTIMGGVFGFIATVLLLLLAAVLATWFSPVRSTNEAMAASAVAGTIASIVMIAGDLAGQLLDSWYRPYGPGPAFSDGIMAGILFSLGCAPVKMVMFIAICVVAGAVFAAFALRLNSMNGEGKERNGR